MTVHRLPQIFRTDWIKQIGSLLAVLVVVAGLVFLGNTARSTASNVDVLANGGFENGFTSVPGCGTVGISWGCFTNGGAANHGFYDDQWERVVASGRHSQLIEINTKGIFEADPDRIAGLYQIVKVVPHATYQFDLKGLIRTTELEGDPWRYRVEVAFAHGATTDWTRVTNWIDVGWDTYYPRTDPGAFLSFNTQVVPSSDHLTVFVRVRKKWGVPEMELDVNLDSISLVGPSPYGYYPPAYHPVTPTVTTTPAAQPPVHAPVATTAPVRCDGTNYVLNGGFEHGFYQTALGAVGLHWAPFVNHGAANYGFYDDQWEPVVAAGEHSQLIEINTYGIAAGDPDRYAGIYQVISGLTPGATYELSVTGLLRGVGGGDDPHRFEAQWGYNRGSNGDWRQVANWQGLDLGRIYPRTEPGALETHTVQFVAPTDTLTLFLRGVKKWGTAETEMDLNVDSISLTRCTTTVVVPPPPPTKCQYVVKAGDTLAKIAARYGVTVHELAAVNNIVYWDVIHVGQVLQIPRCTVHDPYPAPTKVHAPYHPTPTPVPSVQYYTVQPGDTLSSIAAWYGVNVYDLAHANNIYDINHIYVGQVLVIP